MIIVLVCPLTLFFVLFGVAYFSDSITTAWQWMDSHPGMWQLFGLVYVLAMVPFALRLGKPGSKQNSGRS